MEDVMQYDCRNNALPGDIGTRHTENMQNERTAHAIHNFNLGTIVNNNNTTINQTKYPRNGIVTSSNRIFGEDMTTKASEDIVRIVSLNANNMRVTSKNYKQDSLKRWIHENDIDIIGIQEVGIATHMIQRRDTLYERMKDLRWTKIKISAANNVHEKISRAQYGGTAVMTFNRIATRATSKQGKDPTGLGRWSWLLFEGKQNHRTRIISAYNPCKSYGHRTVYMQHKRYFYNKGISTCPRKMFINDLTRQIQTWQSQGDLIVLLIDCNENLAREGPLHIAITDKCRLTDPIRMVYQHATSKLPATSHPPSLSY